MAVRMGGLSKKFLNNKSFVYIYMYILYLPGPVHLHAQVAGE